MAGMNGEHREDPSDAGALSGPLTHRTGPALAAQVRLPSPGLTLGAGQPLHGGVQVCIQAQMDPPHPGRQRRSHMGATVPPHSRPVQDGLQVEVDWDALLQDLNGLQQHQAISNGKHGAGAPPSTDNGGGALTEEQVARIADLALRWGLGEGCSAAWCLWSGWGCRTGPEAPRRRWPEIACISVVG